MTQACRRRSPERGSGCRWDGEEPRTAPSREPQIPKTSVTVSSKPAEIRRVTPCPFRDIRITAVVALDCRTVPLDPFYAHSGRCRRKGKRKCGRSRIPLARVSSDTRLKVWIGWIPGQRARPPRLESFRAGGGLKHKTY